MLCVVLYFLLIQQSVCKQTVAMTSKLAENYNVGSETFIQHQQLASKVLENGMLTAPLEQTAILLGGQLQTQAMSVAGVNNFQWFILTIALLVPIMVVAMKWANSHSHHN